MVDLEVGQRPSGWIGLMPQLIDCNHFLALPHGGICADLRGQGLSHISTRSAHNHERESCVEAGLVVFTIENQLRQLWLNLSSLPVINRAVEQCISDPALMTTRILSRDPRLILPAIRFAQAISKLPPNPEYGMVKPRALIVGGFVRDAILDKDPKDLDIEVYGVSPKDLKRLVRKFFPKVKPA